MPPKKGIPRSKAQKRAEADIERTEARRAANYDKASNALYDFGDDVMEGVAEVLRLAQYGAESCVTCVRSSVYPIKQYLTGHRAGGHQGAAYAQEQMHGEQTFNLEGDT